VLLTGIVVLVVSVVIERAVTIRGAQLTAEAGGDWNAKDVRYAWEGGPPRWMSLIALLAYVGIAVGLVLIVLGLVL
jgi:hypothetical protein